jgi:hypothetical protein
MWYFCNNPAVPTLCRERYSSRASPFIQLPLLSRNAKQWHRSDVIAGSNVTHKLGVTVEQSGEDKRWSADVARFLFAVPCHASWWETRGPCPGRQFLYAASSRSRRYPVRISAGLPAFLTETLRGFTQSQHQNTGRALLLRILEVPGWNPGPRTGYPEISCGFPQFLNANAGAGP